MLKFSEMALLNLFSEKLETKPPLFCGENFSFWKNKMKLFVESFGCKDWNSVVTNNM